MAMRTCTKCNKTKSVSEFRVRTRSWGKADGTKSSHSYVNSQCKECEAEYSKKYSKDIQSDRNKKARLDNSFNDNRTSYRRHNLTLDEFYQLLKVRDGKCHNSMCANPAEFIDHNHDCCAGETSCGKCVRGLLCRGCNSAEGFLKGDADKALALAAYMIATKAAGKYVLVA